MPDLGWLGEVGKVVAGGALGWISRTFTEKDRRRKLRRGLYRELVRDYAAVRVNLDMAQDLRGQKNPLFGLALRFENVSVDYYEHAKKDMDRFSELREAASFDWFFRKLALLLEMRGGNNGAALVATGLQLCQTTEESFVAGGLSLKFAKKVLDSDEYSYLSGRVEAMRLHGIPANELMPFRTESQG